MASNPLFRETVKAMALGEGGRAKELNSQIPDADREAFAIYVAAVFSGAVEHRFKDDQSQEAIVRFVNEMRHDYRKSDPPFKPLTMEAVIRVAFGEDHLLDEVSLADQLRCQYQAIRKIVDQSEVLKTRLDDLLKDGETIAARWMAESD